jgi:hypothetical protein
MKATTIAIPEEALGSISAKAKEFDITIKESERYSGREGTLALDLSGPVSGIDEFIRWYRVY